MGRVTDGRVYTPPVLAQLCHDLTMDTAVACGIARADTPLSVWDPCCGDGALLRPFMGHAQCYGCDIDQPAVENAQANGLSAAAKADLFDRDTALPLPDGAVLVCNPPYVGRSNLGAVVGRERLDWLKRTYRVERAGSCDLAGYVLRHILAVWRPAVSTWIVTNTIAQGATRRVGLRWACTEGGYVIVTALKDIQWPGETAVTIHVCTLVRGASLHKGEIRYEPNYQL